ncbi:uncharacterized protein LOC127732061 isoform X2 [Mytilus californianus]|uniref:uncharacterized protein LOC127732061 isoform X2 n=1 Tax=Mytilus californianus TaxID=6549 RepID=UPI002248286D|nr:uncharacterized protein LOC127732061 isoform X2 [Mytilus californianus]
MTRRTLYSLVFIVLLLHGRVCMGSNCYCFNADELDTDDIHDESAEKCLSSSSTSSEDYVFIYKFNVTESCVGKCGKKLDKSLPCQCNKPCTKHKDCCEDYDAFCSESCVDRCETKPDRRLSCQCNTDCKHNCCEDYDTFCSEEENGKWNVLRCEGGETSEDLLLVKSSSFKCRDLVSFYCRNGSSPQKSITTVKSRESNFTTPLKPDQITPQIGVIVGIVSPIVAIGVVVFVVIVCRRRRSARRKPVHKQDSHGQSDTEKIEHLGNKNGYAYCEIEMEATNKKDHMDNGDNEYTTGTSDVYDHLNEHKNRKIQTENPHAIYDHAIGDNAEPDYDSTKHVVPTNLDYQEVRIRSEDESYREKL